MRENGKIEQPIIQWNPVTDSHPDVVFRATGDHDDGHHTIVEHWGSENLLLCLGNGNIHMGEYVEMRTYDVSVPSSPKLLETEFIWEGVYDDYSFDSENVCAWSYLPVSYLQ